MTLVLPKGSRPPEGARPPGLAPESLRLRRLSAVVLLAGVLLGVPLPTLGEPVDALVARVGRDVITRSRVLQEARVSRWDPAERAWGSLDTVAAELVRRRLFAGEAEKLSLAPSEEQVAASVENLAEGRGDAAAFWADMAGLGISEEQLRDRSREILLMRRYLEVRQGMAYVPEGELRAFLRDQAHVFGEQPAEEARESARAYLTERKHRQELKRWLERQVTGGRVRLLGPVGSDAERPGSAGEMPGQRFSLGDTVLVSLLPAS